MTPTLARCLATMLVLIATWPVAAGDGGRAVHAALIARFQPSTIELQPVKRGAVTRAGRILVVSMDAVPAKPFRVLQPNSASPPVHVMDFAKIRIAPDGRITAEPAPIQLAQGSRVVVLDVKVEASGVRLLTHTAEPLRIAARGEPVYGCTEFVFEFEPDLIRTGHQEPVVARIERSLGWTAEERMCARSSDRLCLEP